MNFPLSKTLGLYVNTNFGGTSIRCLLVGFTEMRSDFFFTSNVPKPCMATAFPSSNCRVMTDSSEDTSSEVSFRVYPSLLDSSDVNSLLFTGRCSFLMLADAILTIFLHMGNILPEKKSDKTPKKVEIIGIDDFHLIKLADCQVCSLLFNQHFRIHFR